MEVGSIPLLCHCNGMDNGVGDNQEAGPLPDAFGDMPVSVVSRVWSVCGHEWTVWTCCHHACTIRKPRRIKSTSVVLGFDSHESCREGAGAVVSSR